MAQLSTWRRRRRQARGVWRRPAPRSFPPSLAHPLPSRPPSHWLATTPPPPPPRAHPLPPSGIGRRPRRRSAARLLRHRVLLRAPGQRHPPLFISSARPAHLATPHGASAAHTGALRLRHRRGGRRRKVGLRALLRCGLRPDAIPAVAGGGRDAGAACQGDGVCGAHVPGGGEGGERARAQGGGRDGHGGLAGEAHPPLHTPAARTSFPPSPPPLIPPRCHPRPKMHFCPHTHPPQSGALPPSPGPRWTPPSCASTPLVSLARWPS